MHGPQLCVEVDNSRYVPLLSLAKSSEGRLPLTTITPRQHRAIVKLAVVKGDQAVSVGTVELSGVDLQSSDHPKIDLLASHDGSGHVSLQIHLGGRLFTTAAVDVTRHLPRPRWIPWALAAFALALIAAAVALALLSGRVSDDNADPSARRATESVDQTEGEADLSTASGAVDRSAPRQAKVDPAVTLRAPTVEEEAAFEPSGPTALIPTPADPAFIYFLPDSSRILPEAERALTRLADLMLQVSGYRLHIVGHCAPAGSEAGREEISRMRARNVAAVLANRGFTEFAQVEGRGATEPITPDDRLLYLNRRVEIWATPAP